MASKAGEKQVESKKEEKAASEEERAHKKQEVKDSACMFRGGLRRKKHHQNYNSAKTVWKAFFCEPITSRLAGSSVEAASSATSRTVLELVGLSWVGLGWVRLGWGGVALGLGFRVLAEHWPCVKDQSAENRSRWSPQGFLAFLASAQSKQEGKSAASSVVLYLLIPGSSRLSNLQGTRVPLPFFSKLITARAVSEPAAAISCTRT